MEIMGSREAFERWAKGRLLLQRRESGEYEYGLTREVWSAWQAGVWHGRESCANGCEQMSDGFEVNSDWAKGYVQALKDVADGIRNAGDSQ